MRKSAPLFCALLLSLSARRAWIEIVESDLHIARAVVALRKESVDRNIVMLIYHQIIYVALRKESVDRNTTIVRSYIALVSRSPQGERG